MATATPTGSTNELFRQAVDTFQSAIKAGVKIQEDSTRQFIDMLRDFGSPMQWQKKGQEFVGEAVKLTQQNVEETVRAISQNAKTAMELFQKTMETRPGETEADNEARAREMWESTMAAMRAGTETILQANAHILDSWTDLAKKFSSQPTNGQH
jgi:hypothetical protein